jgi:hypothetical protein
MILILAHRFHHPRFTVKQKYNWLVAEKRTERSSTCEQRAVILPEAMFFMPPRPSIAMMDPAPSADPVRSGRAAAASGTALEATEKTTANPFTTTALASTPAQLLAHTDVLLDKLRQVKKLLLVAGLRSGL